MPNKHEEQIGRLQAEEKSLRETKPLGYHETKAAQSIGQAIVSLQEAAAHNVAQSKPTVATPAGEIEPTS